MQTKVLNTLELSKLFEVGPMTIHNWRHGRGKKKSLLPFHTSPVGKGRHHVHFLEHEVVQWARNNGVYFEEAMLQYLGKIPGEVPPGSAPVEDPVVTPTPQT